MSRVSRLCLVASLFLAVTAAQAQSKVAIINLQKALLDTADYPVGRPVTDRQFDELRLTRHTFHPDWNYTLLPRTGN